MAIASVRLFAWTAAAIALCCVVPVHAGERVVVEAGSTMSYLTNSSDPGLGIAWIDSAFDDTAWPSGEFGVGFDTLPGALDLIQTSVAPGTVSIYTRTRFAVPDVLAVQSVTLGADFDDGFVAWINGVEVYRSPQIPAGRPAWDTRPTSHESSNGSVPDYTPLVDISAAAMPVLADGENVLAIAVWNAGAGSSDLVLVPRLALDETLTLTRGAYLQRGTSTEITVRFRTDAPVDSRVTYGNAPDSLTEFIDDPAVTTEHVVTLTGLAPNTRYYYSVGTVSTVLAGGDTDHSFKTAPSFGMPEPSRIWVLGDSGTHNSVVRAVRDAYETFTGSQETDLWLMLGDNAYPDGTDSDYQASVFDVFPAMLRKSVLWPSLGNHDTIVSDSDTQTGPYFDMFTLPAAGEAGGVPSGTEAYYSFDYANIHFVVLDSQDVSRLPAGPMLTWLEQDLAQNIQDWTVAFWHHPPYSKGKRDSDVELRQIEMRENAVPILEDHGIDLVLCGHSHSYERSFLIDGHYGLSATFNGSMLVDGGDGSESGDGAYAKAQLGSLPHSGVVYTVAGSSGQISGGTLDHPVMTYSVNTQGSVVLDVAGNRLDLRFLDKNGAVLDDFTMIKGDASSVPIAGFTGSPTSGVAPLAVQFVDQSVGVATAWDWDFTDDGASDSRLRHPLAVYAEPGLHTARLVVSNAIGSDQEVSAGLICVVSSSAIGVEGLELVAVTGELSWAPAATGSRYDVVRGDLASLRSNDGDFAVSAVSCLEGGGSDTEALDATTPAPGIGHYYLVRPADCSGQVGTYDTVEPGQTVSRDDSIPDGVCL